MKHLLIALSLLAFTMCKPDTPQNEKPEEATQIVVMSSNIAYTDGHNNDQFSWPNRRLAYFAMFEEIKPDIVGMQEATPWDLNDEQGGRPNQTGDLLERFPEYANYRVYPTDIMDMDGGKQCGSRHGGVMILYKRDRFTVLDKGIFWLSKTPETPANSNPPFDCMDNHTRACVWVHFQDKESGKDVFMFNTHLPYDPNVKDNEGNRIYNVEARIKCAELIVSRIKSIAGADATVFLTGDMNSAYEDTALHKYSGVVHSVSESLRPFGYLWKARTEAPITDNYNSNNRFDDTKETGKIDHIFYRNANPLEFKTVNNPYLGVKYISDHYPIVCRFEY